MDTPSYPIALAQIMPPADLAHQFGPIYRFSIQASQIEWSNRADFPHIRLFTAGTTRFRFPQGWATIPKVALIGATSRVVPVRADGPACVVGFTVLPYGWTALGFGDARKAADRAIDLLSDGGQGHIPAADLGRLYAGIGDEPDFSEVARTMWDFLRACIRPVPPEDRAFIRAVDIWLDDHRSPPVTVLEAETGLSLRQIERSCNRLYGAPPRYLARKYRALRAALTVVEQGADWRDMGGDAFYDHSHFIRECRHFTGLTPRRLRNDPRLALLHPQHPSRVGPTLAAGDAAHLRK